MSCRCPCGSRLPPFTEPLGEPHVSDAACDVALHVGFAAYVSPDRGVGACVRAACLLPACDVVAAAYCWPLQVSQLQACCTHIAGSSDQRVALAIPSQRYPAPPPVSHHQHHDAPYVIPSYWSCCLTARTPREVRPTSSCFPPSALTVLSWLCPETKLMGVGGRLVPLKIAGISLTRRRYGSMYVHTKPYLLTNLRGSSLPPNPPPPAFSWGAADRRFLSL